jgi:hypothetical protein
MAKRKSNPTADELQNAFEEDGVKFRKYKNDGAGFDKLEESDEITGVLVSIRDHQITDKRTKQLKDIRVYGIRTGDGTVKKIGGRALLDRMFDDIMDENGGYDVTNRRYSGPGYDAIKDKVIKINRGEDTTTSGGDPLGTYEISIEE